MRLVFYLFFISQLLNFIGVFAEKVREDSSGLNSINWEKVEENKSKPLKKIIWKSYKNDESYFGNKKQQSSIIKNTNSSNEERISESSKKSGFYITEIEPFLPLNNFLDYGNFTTSVRWKSSFDGGVSGGIGQQNPSFVFDYGISDSSILSFYISGADDELYNLVGGKSTNYYWQSYALCQ